jgi:hydroxymethylbilane synthase
MKRHGLIRVGTRGSALALAQARFVAAELDRHAGVDVQLVTIRTAGDRGVVADKSRFVREIDAALLAGEVDLAVHSAKDVPGTLPDGLVIASTPAAEDARDALVGAAALADLPQGARVGTASLRRRSQLLAIRPDLEPVELRGNVDTRLTKLAKGGFDAIVLALAGLRRLGRESDATAMVAVDEIVPAPGQGILALEARASDERACALARSVGDDPTFARLEAERAAVTALDASCHTPVGVHARPDGGRLVIDAYAGLPDGSEWMRDRIEKDLADPAAAGRELAARMLSAGAEELLNRAGR